MVSMRRYVVLFIYIIMGMVVVLAAMFVLDRSRSILAVAGVGAVVFIVYLIAQEVLTTKWVDSQKKEKDEKGNKSEEQR